VVFRDVGKERVKEVKMKGHHGVLTGWSKTLKETAATITDTCRVEGWGWRRGHTHGGRGNESGKVGRPTGKSLRVEFTQRNEHGKKQPCESLNERKCRNRETVVELMRSGS